MHVGVMKMYGGAAAATMTALAAAAGLAGPAAADSNKTNGCLTLNLYGPASGYTAHALNPGGSDCNFVGYIVIKGPGLEETTEPSKTPQIPFLPGHGKGPVKAQIFRESDGAKKGEVELKVK